MWSGGVGCEPPASSWNEAASLDAAAAWSGWGSPLLPHPSAEAALLRRLSPAASLAPHGRRDKPLVCHRVVSIHQAGRLWLLPGLVTVSSAESGAGVWFYPKGEVLFGVALGESATVTIEEVLAALP